MTRKNILVRLSPEILLGKGRKDAELLADMVGMYMSDMYNFVLMVVDLHLTGEQIYDEGQVVEEFFMGRREAYGLMRLIESRIPEILSYFPDNITEIRYLRTIDDGVYALGIYPIDLSIG